MARPGDVHDQGKPRDPTTTLTVAIELTDRRRHSDTQALLVCCRNSAPSLIQLQLCAKKELLRKQGKIKRAGCAPHEQKQTVNGDLHQCCSQMIGLHHTTTNTLVCTTQPQQGCDQKSWSAAPHNHSHAGDCLYNNKLVQFCHSRSKGP